MSSQYLNRSQTRKRLLDDDVLERYENYGAFRSDGAQVKMRDVHILIGQSFILPAAPSIGATFFLLRAIRGEVK